MVDLKSRQLGEKKGESEMETKKKDEKMFGIG